MAPPAVTSPRALQVRPGDVIQRAPSLLPSPIRIFFLSHHLHPLPAAGQRTTRTRSVLRAPLSYRRARIKAGVQLCFPPSPRPLRAPRIPPLSPRLPAPFGATATSCCSGPARPSPPPAPRSATSPCPCSSSPSPAPPPRPASSPPSARFLASSSPCPPACWWTAGTASV